LIVTRSLGGLNLLGKIKRVGHAPPERSDSELPYTKFVEQVRGYAKALRRVK
jgi:hypothetical protein